MSTPTEHPETPDTELLPSASLHRTPNATDQRYKLHRRFDRLGRLYGDGAVSLLMKTRIIVFGLGGVGSFTTEALARSAIGHLTLVDFDDVCVTNVNRQMQALRGNIGKPKADVLAERAQRINPQATIVPIRKFYKAEHASDMLTIPLKDGSRAVPDYVVDCIDNMTAKAHLLAECKKRGIAVVSSMGAAGKADPTQIKVADMADTTDCRMAKEMRTILRKEHGFPEAKQGPFGIQSVYSTEPRIWPKQLTYDNGEGFKCVCPHKSDEHSCDGRNLIDGTVSYVTGAFGLHLAALVVNDLVKPLMAEATAAADKHGHRRNITD